MFRTTAVTGFAILKDGEININSVSGTRRAAIVNWLCVERCVLILNSASDESIETIWQRHRGDADAVHITVNHQTDENAPDFGQPPRADRGNPRSAKGDQE